jgi:hypothetical protein
MMVVNFAALLLCVVDDDQRISTRRSVQLYGFLQSRWRGKRFADDGLLPAG